MTNALLHETSPYLLQHAHNPVRWYPWGYEALQKAQKENKPILVSIGYSACHWCHVMEHESFQDAATAAIMNKHFINIKIDREERPDLDHLYMDAVQAMTGSGGWPLNVFLTPDKKPFYGGTYFPPKGIPNRPAWKDVLLAVADAFKNKREAIEQQANGFVQHLFQSNSFGIRNDASPFSIQQINTACEHLLKQADKQWGGFGAAPKFPQTFSIQFLLKYYQLQRNRNTTLAHAALQQALLSLDKMIDGGIYDQLGGGFARYATDAEWLAPHFEKMLYDNALLVTTLSEAYQITQNEKYKLVIDHTLAFVERELQHSSGGFYAALDADSEGVEGKYYVWSRHEVVRILGDDAPAYCTYYDITTQGNWEHTNILRVLTSLPQCAQQLQITQEQLIQIIERSNVRLLAERNKRTRPALDDKILLSWNALMNTACCKAYAATGNEQYKHKAIVNMQFLLNSFDTADGLQHVWKNNTAKFSAFLDDYAYLIQSLLQLHRITADTHFLIKAKILCEQVITNFSNSEGFFYYTSAQQQDVIVRKVEVYDGATPSGNAVMVQNLLELGLLFDIAEWQSRAQNMLQSLSTVVVKYPTSFGVWLFALYQMIEGAKEIVLIGQCQNALKQLLQNPLPYCVVMASDKENEFFPLLKNKFSDKELSIFICENYACRQPVHSVDALLQILND